MLDHSLHAQSRGKTFKQSPAIESGGFSVTEKPTVIHHGHWPSLQSLRLLASSNGEVGAALDSSNGVLPR